MYLAMTVAYHVLTMSHLIFALEDQDVGDSSEGDAQVNNFGFGDVRGNVADVNDAGRGIAACNKGSSSAF